MIWWSLDTILEAYPDIEEKRIRAALNQLVVRELIYRDNQKTPWYAAIEQDP
jgi:uncharacterized protein (DUF433 family)